MSRILSSVVWSLASVAVTGMPVAGQADPQERESWSTSAIHGTPDPPMPYLVQPAFSLTFTEPLDMAPEPGTNRLFVLERRGTIVSFENRPNAEHADPVVDLRTRHSSLNAIYAIAFHPQYEQNRRIYVCCILGNDVEDGSFIAEYQVSRSEPPVIDPATERVIIRWWAGGHNGCSLKFGHDGYLYISTGDGGAPSPPDPLLAGQDVSNLLSCILRIDVDHVDGDRQYRVPPDNPFLNVPGARPEIWAFGFRNPWRMSIDRETGDLWVGDVGWQLWEMIYRVERGGNYGWPVMEGPQPALPESRRGPGPILPPAVSHPHSEASSITGGYVYHGARLPELRGAYLYGDYQSGRVWALRDRMAKKPAPEEIAQTPLQLVSFAEDHAGELYLLDHQRSQKIYQLTPNPDRGHPRVFPQRLSDTGLFASVAEQRPAAGVAEYQIHAEHWADSATSQRWMALPGTDPITIDPKGRWVFPEGSVLAKTVSLQLVSGDPGSSRRLETQILHREQGSWRAYSYRWNDLQTDAELIPAQGDSLELTVMDARAPSGLRHQTWRFAARSECQMCHNPWVEAKTTISGVQSASPLAVSTGQLDRMVVSASGAPVNQLDHLEATGWIHRSTPEAADPPPAEFVSPYEASAPLEARVRSWLHVNCAHCHQPHAGGSALIELTGETPMDQMKLLNAKPLQGSFGISQARLVSAGDPHGSVLYYRVSKTGAGRMPRVGSEEVDVVGTALIRDWIVSITPEHTSTQSSDTPASQISTREIVPPVLMDLSALNRSDAEREQAVQSMLGTTRSALQLMDYLSGLQDAETKATIARIAIRQPNAEIRDLFERFVPPSERVKTLGAIVNPAQLLAQEGNAARGHDIFFREGSGSCRSCHRIAGQGETLGPDLSGIGKKYSRADLLTHLLEPSRLIEPPYVPWILETKAGLVHTGLVTQRSDSEVVLRAADNREIRTATDQIESLVSQPKSLMPELLLRDLTLQQAADLLQFLTEQTAGAADKPQDSRK